MNMNKKIMCRVDDYYNNFGTLIEITTKDTYYGEKISEEIANNIGEYIRVTEFICDINLDNKEAWENGEILNTYFYMCS